MYRLEPGQAQALKRPQYVSLHRNTDRSQAVDSHGALSAFSHLNLVLDEPDLIAQGSELK